MRADIALGVLTVLMALVGGVVTLHAPTKWPAKITYSGIFSLLGTLSIVYVIKQANENATSTQNLTNALVNLGQSTTKIGEMTALNTQLQDKLLRQSDTITYLSRQNIAATTANSNLMTGGNSFCYLRLGRPYLFFIHAGQFPVHGVSARIVKLDQNGHVRQENLMGLTVSLGDMIQKHVSVQPIPLGLEISPDYFRANIFFTARNGDWMQLLREQRVNGKVVSAIRVVGRFASLRKEKLLCESIDPDFPRNVNGDIDDDFRVTVGPKPPHCQ